jgi:hypothetical protein
MKKAGPFKKGNSGKHLWLKSIILGRVRLRGQRFKVSLSKKFVRPYRNRKKLGMVVHAVILAMTGSLK